MQSILEFEKYLSDLPTQSHKFFNFELLVLNQNVELGFSSGGYDNEEDALCPSEFEFLIEDGDIEGYADGQDLEEIKKELCYQYIFDYETSFYTGITDSFAGPMSSDHTVGFFDFGGDYVIFYTSPDDSATRFCAYMRKESFYSNLKEVIEVIFLSKGEIIDADYPFLSFGLWGRNEFYNFFDMDFAMQLVYKTLEVNNLWFEEQEKMIEYLAMRSNGKNSEIDMKLQKLTEIGQSILNGSEQTEDHEEELSLDEKKLLLANIFQYTVKIYEGNSYTTNEILPEAS